MFLDVSWAGSREVKKNGALQASPVGDLILKSCKEGCGVINNFFSRVRNNKQAYFLCTPTFHLFSHDTGTTKDEKPLINHILLYPVPGTKYMIPGSTSYRAAVLLLPYAAVVLTLLSEQGSVATQKDAGAPKSEK